MVGCSKENFDSYFSKLQNICTDSMNEDVKSSSAAAAANAMDPAKGHHIQQGDAPPPLRIHWVVLLDFSPEILYSVCCLIDVILKIAYTILHFPELNSVGPPCRLYKT